MAESGKKIKDYPSLTTTTGNTRFVVSEAGNTYNISLSVMFANCVSNTSFSNSAYVSIQNLVIRRANTPANSTISVPERAIWADNNYIYVAIANNNIKRAVLETFT